MAPWSSSTRLFWKFTVLAEQPPPLPSSSMYRPEPVTVFGWAMVRVAPLSTYRPLNE